MTFTAKPMHIFWQNTKEIFFEKFLIKYIILNSFVLVYMDTKMQKKRKKKKENISYCVAISVNPQVCFILVLILISMFLK